MKKIKYRAVVTGATKGIGFAISERLLRDGVEVIATGTQKNSNYPNGASYYSVDFTNERSTNEFIETISPNLLRDDLRFILPDTE